MPQITVNGRELYFEQRGSGPPLLLIHSLGTASWMWREQIRSWSRDFEVLAFDARAHGRSSRQGPLSVEAAAADLLEGMQRLSKTSLSVVAISMGGPIVTQLYSAAPELIARVVIADSFARQGPAGEERVRALRDELASCSMQVYGRRYAELALHPGTSVDHFDELASSIGAMAKEDYLEMAASVFTSDVSSLMPGIRVPVLVAVGAQDARTPPALSREIADLIPGAELKVIEGASHLANLDNPAGFHEAIYPFLRNALDAA